MEKIGRFYRIAKKDSHKSIPGAVIGQGYILLDSSKFTEKQAIEIESTADPVEVKSVTSQKLFEMIDFKEQGKQENGRCKYSGYLNTKNTPDSYGDIPTNFNGAAVYDLTRISGHDQPSKRYRRNHKLHREKYFCSWRGGGCSWQWCYSALCRRYQLCVTAHIRQHDKK